MKLKLTYIVSDIDKSLAFEWTALELAKHYTFFFILISKENSALSIFCKKNNIKYYWVNTEHTIIRKWFKVFLIILKEKPIIVHTHLWQANIVGLSAAWLLRTKKRIFTRHHALVHYDEFPSGRKWDLLCNYFATHIIAISENVKTILIEKDRATKEKVFVVYHGFKFHYFSSVTESDIHRLKSKYRINDQYPVIGVIARYLQWKGIDYTIAAFKKLLSEYPNACLLLANANGPHQHAIRQQLKALPENRYREIIFEEDLASLYKVFSVYVHVPINSSVEAFGQTYIEALASGVPSVFTLSGIAAEFIIDNENALVVPFKDADSILRAIKQILEMQQLTSNLVRNGMNSIKKFEFEQMISKLIILYA